MDLQSLLTTLKNGGFDQNLAALYAPTGDPAQLAAARDRMAVNFRAAYPVFRNLTVPAYEPDELRDDWREFIADTFL